MEVMPASVGRVACGWEEQSLDLRAASRQIAAAGSAGFSDGVRASAARFLTSWERHTAALNTRCATQTDGLRSTISDYLQTDALINEEYFRLVRCLAECRR